MITAFQHCANLSYHWSFNITVLLLLGECEVGSPLAFHCYPITRIASNHCHQPLEVVNMAFVTNQPTLSMMI